MAAPNQGLTGLGKVAVALVVLGCIGGAVYFLTKNKPSDPAVQPAGGGGGGGGSSESPAGLDAPAPEGMAETLAEVPKLQPAAPCVLPADGIVTIELSEYAGYAGLIAANHGLEPNPESVFKKKHGFLVRITLSEEESWNALNTGKIAASATTVDVLAAYGRQFDVVVPVQIGFSRGADGIVVRSDIKRINHLKGRTLATAQFTEAEFFARYLAQEAGLPVKTLPDLNTPPDPNALNLVFCEDAFTAADVFLAELKSGRTRLAGCVTWDPKTTSVARESAGKARVLVTNRNLLIVADILIVNRGFAQANPRIVDGLVAGLLEGNRMVRDNPDMHIDVIARAFNSIAEEKWDRAKAKGELEKVHLSNLPENRAFFAGAMDLAGSYAGIFGSTTYAYGPAIIRDPADPERFLALDGLKAAEASGAFAEQKLSIQPIRSKPGGAVESDPLLSKDIRFLFKPNSAELELSDAANLRNLEALKSILKISPGSVIVLRGHVDDSLKAEYSKQGPEVLRKMTMVALDLSRNRANEIKRLLIERHHVDAARLEAVGRGWEEPAGADPEKNRRVEAQWFTVE